MSVVLFQQNGSFYQPICSVCKQVMPDLLTAQEMGEMASRGVEIYCNECDNVGLDEIPPTLFVTGVDNYVLYIDGKPYIVNWPGLARANTERISFWKGQVDYWRDRLQAVMGK